MIPYYLYEVRGILWVVLFQLIAHLTYAQLPLFDQEQINTIKIIVDNKDSMNAIYTGTNKAYHMAKFIYFNGQAADTLDSVGIRLRGNTSLNAKKKSFKISFDEYVYNRKYKGVHKLNLIGNHNDPTYVREKLFYELYNKIGLYKRRTSFVKFYINDIYFGLMSNLEEIDKEWLEDRFGYKDGNLYKCYYGATLATRSDNNYKFMLYGNQRVYELATNEIADNYSDLERLIKTINQNPTHPLYLSYLDTIFHTNDYIKSYAFDILTGNWDSYAYNSNNFYLYNDSGKFRFITFDPDNTFGIDWSGIDWSIRPIKNWFHPSQPRPLIKNILNHTSAVQKFLFYIDSIRTHITRPDLVFPRLDTLQYLLLPHVAADSFKKLDYGYTQVEFLKGFNAGVDAHSPIGIKPFLQIRYQTAIPLIIEDEQTIIAPYPNPTQNQLRIQLAQASNISIQNMNGHIVIRESLGAGEQILDLSRLASGTYLLKTTQKNGQMNSWIIFKQ